MRAFGKIIVTVTMLTIAFTALSACSANSADGYRLDNIRIYQNTPAWKLAKAVKNEVTGTIAKIAKENPVLLDYQDPVYGTTLLCWAVGMEKYNSAEALLKAGANPDIISTYVGGTALYLAAGYSYVDTDFDSDPKYVKLLLEYGADPEIGFVGNDHNNATEIGETPLMMSIGCGLEKTKALVEAGADINAKTKTQTTAAIKALLRGSGNMSPSEREYAYYLIVEKRQMYHSLTKGSTYIQLLTMTRMICFIQ
ncbi:hypothetical protein SDC9_94730 [bioreactor metagenome]|uniref:Uncharacterized protein n=1 Tax=bioreactor metagenome TaxID=1076179 RepID=A0A645A491_9ZZZZ